MFTSEIYKPCQVSEVERNRVSWRNPVSVTPLKARENRYKIQNGDTDEIYQN
ncbi:hypothetical protein LAY57_18750 [Argonema antarcticum A004/B2]|nr:hypothetical protein [Argonema antarcticum A004/B2]